MSPHFEIALDAEGPNPLQVGMDRVRSGVLAFCTIWVGLLGSSHGVSNPELRSVGVGQMKFNLFESADRDLVPLNWAIVKVRFWG